ncbi:Taurine catabolism dioxygenase TauD, TfdA family [Popillia japonica]|uniref:Taurine catabolism dioxygenase TauD, TfdA family n=1 Tax=Popillia japonica TaxID=7064 RepID=A0AAW1IZH5_POPJA
MNVSRFMRVLTQINSNEIILSRKSNLFKITRRWFGIRAAVSDDNESLEVKYQKRTDKFPLVWLRDNCTCENCFHKSSQSRIINWKEFDINIKVNSVEAKDDNNIEINWNDNHKSVYSWDWLEKRSFSEAGQEKFLKDVYMPTKKLWSKNEFFDILRSYEYKDIINEDEALYNWLKDLAVYGVSLIKNAFENEKECQKISERVAFVKKTHYGESFYVVAKEGTNNVAYLSNPLQLHTDLPYYHYKPGVILLHCIVQNKGKGGGNLLTDAFYVAENLRNKNKDVFDVLASIDVNWLDIGEEDGVPFHKIHRDPIIALDSHGNIRTIRHSIPQRDSYFTVNIEDVKPWYKALKVFVDQIYSNAAHFKTQPGDILAVDNTRLVHGRLGYQDTKDVKRLLVGNYLDWDEIHSKLRVLGKRFAKAS